MKIRKQYIGLLILCLGFLPGCVTVDEQKNVLTDRADNFGELPTNYEQKIRRDFTQFKTIYHPENLDFKIRPPVKFYVMSGESVTWFDWVCEIALPDKAIYRFLTGDNEAWTPYYVRFHNEEIINVYNRDDYVYLKKSFGFELDEKGHVHQALNRGALVNKGFNNLISFRDDLPGSPIITVTTVKQKITAKNKPVTIKNKIETVSSSTQKADIPSQIRELYQLYKEGILSEEEFTAKKKQLLGL